MNNAAFDGSAFHLFAQHGWADGNQDMVTLASQLVGKEDSFRAPNLGYLLTWLRMEPLIQKVEAIATQTFETRPLRPWRIVGHSMGGLIWLEVLNRHPEWWSRVQSLVLVASPVGGADLGRMVDPLQWGIGIAPDLGINRRAIAESIATQIPTLVVAGDSDGGSDGTIPVMSTPITHASFVCLPNIAHADLKTHPEVIQLIRRFWNSDSVGVAIAPDPLIHFIRSIPGMTDSHPRDFPQAHLCHTFKDQRTLRIWKNSLGIHHIYLASKHGDCIYAGFVGWMHTNELLTAIHHIKIGLPIRFP